MGSNRQRTRTRGRWVRSANATSVLCGPQVNWKLSLTSHETGSEKNWPELAARLKCRCASSGMCRKLKQKESSGEAEEEKLKAVKTMLDYGNYLRWKMSCFSQVNKLQQKRIKRLHPRPLLPPANWSIILMLVLIVYDIQAKKSQSGFFPAEKFRLVSNFCCRWVA